jgi:hypothetical protein
MRVLGFVEDARFAEGLAGGERGWRAVCGGEDPGRRAEAGAVYALPLIVSIYISLVG